MNIWISSITELDGICETYLQHVPSEEDRAKILKFRFEDDRKRALLSVLMQRALIREYLGLEDDSGYEVVRTTEGKPFARSLSSSRPVGSWNYNLSHHGNFVGIVSHPLLLVGVDIVDTRMRSALSSSAQEYIKSFDGYLTSPEVHAILSQDTEERRYEVFFILWSLKEAFIKAIGIGLGFDLLEISFTLPRLLHQNHQQQSQKERDDDDAYEHDEHFQGRLFGKAEATIRGVAQNDWSFQYFSLDERHIMSIARGPIEQGIESYRQAACLTTPSPTFCLKSLAHEPLPRAVQRGLKSLLVNRRGLPPILSTAGSSHSHSLPPLSYSQSERRLPACEIL